MIKNGIFILKTIFTSFLLVISAIAVAQTPVDPSDYTGSRDSSASGGMFATQKWGSSDNGFQVSWNISEKSGVFHYMYSITGIGGAKLSKGLSHFILETSTTITPKNVHSLIVDPNIPISDGPKIFSPGHPSNPGLPADIYGIKFDIKGKGEKVQLDFFSERIPIWGDFYAKDGKDKGKDVYAYSTGFGFDPIKGTKDFTPWIPTPDTHSVAVPEPSTWLMLVSVLCFVAFVQREKIARRFYRRK